MRSKTLFILALFCTGFMACKKSDSTAPSVPGSILGKWNFQQGVINDFFSGSSHVTTYPGDPSDYVDFRSDGKVYVRVWSSNDTSTYTMIDDTHVRMDPGGDTSEIIMPNVNTLHLYQKQLYGGGDYSESTIYLHK